MDNDKINIIEKTKKIVDPWEDYINENYDNLFLEILDQMEEKKGIFEKKDIEYQNSDIYITIEDTPLYFLGCAEGFYWFKDLNEFFKIGFKDKTKNNFESRLVVKNIGKIPAFNIILDFSKMNFTVGGISMSDCNSTDCGIPITKLAAGETTEIPALPHIGMPAGTNVNTCDYILKIKYELRLPFYKTIMDKIWHIELRNSGDEFVWQVAMR